MTIQQLLIKYWGHKTFRPLQEDIIDSVMQGKDTLALMPTGGGKSLCYQLPAMAMDGICIVISPLIALMRDQVEKLKQKEINAVAIYSGMSKSEIDIAFDNCVYNGVKLLYLSPERLTSDIAIARIGKMKVNLIAVDEAHCISHWGYDFRPPYLRIAEIKQYLKDVPVLALTATATSEVVNDIQKKLLFKTENVFRVSFERKNLRYTVNDEGDKYFELLKFIRREKGQGIIYARNRKKTNEIAEFLNNNSFSVTYYHAGLETKVRSNRQKEWMNGKINIIVCTTAFGMGIDKPDVRFVIHYDPPESIEEYFQQAGRAGRDEIDAEALLMFNDTDTNELERLYNLKFPGIDKIKDIYHALGNYYQLAVGSGQDESFDFEIRDFCNNYKLETMVVFNSLKFLEREGYIILTERINSPSRLHFKMNKEELYKFQIGNMQYDNFIKLILRSYGGLFNDYQSIYENDLAYKYNNVPQENIVKLLGKLKQEGVVEYIPRKSKPQIIYCSPRIDEADIYISNENYNERKIIAHKKLHMLIDYASNEHKCRSQMLLSYFGEDNAKRCGICDFCYKRNVLDINELEFDMIIDKIKPVLIKEPHTLDELFSVFDNIDKNKIIKVVKWLKDYGKIHLNVENKYEWKKAK
jgi:ATP-dependent DNA helicase RecQ